MAGSIGQPTIGWLPWVGEYAVSAAFARTNNSAWLGMGYHLSPNTQNNYIEWNVWLDSGDWKLAVIYTKDSTVGIQTWTANGSAIGTIDGYAAATAYNQYSEIAFSVATAGVKALRSTVSTRNASATGWYQALHSIALIKTAGAHSTPGGVDTPGHTWQYLPWMGSKANTNWAAPTQDSACLGGGYHLDSNAGDQTKQISWDVWLDTGTYKFALVYVQNTDMGIYDIKLDGVSKGTIDGYGATARNIYAEITGIAVASAGVKTFSIHVATKNASSTNYRGALQSLAWIRTGA